MESKHVFLFCVGLYSASSIAFATGNKFSNDLSNLDQETCTIKKPTCASDSQKDNHSANSSEKRDLGTEFALYQQWKNKLKQNPALPIYVEDPMTESKESFEAYLLANLDKLKATHKDKKSSDMLKLLKDLIQSQKNYLSVIKAMPNPQRVFATENLPLSRFKLKSEAYSEKNLERLKKIFPNELKSEHDLTEEQKQAFIQYGGVAILAAQGLAANIHAQTHSHSEPTHP